MINSSMIERDINLLAAIDGCRCLNPMGSVSS